MRSDNGGHWRGSEQDYIQNDLTGEVHHLFEHVELNEEEEGGYDSDDYWDAVVATEPDVHDALSWAASNLSHDFLSDYNAALDSDNHEEVHQYLQIILEEYRSSVPTQEDAYEEQEDASDDGEVEITQEAFDEAVAALTETEPQGEELSDEWQEAADQYRESDPTYAGIAAATAAFHAGEVTAEEAIEWVLEYYDIQDVARVYQSWNH